MREGRPPRVGRSFALRAMAAGFACVLAVGAGLVGVVLVELDSTREAYAQPGRAALSTRDIDTPPPGGAQTIMLLGTDERLGEDASAPGDARSDTIILVRLDPEADAIRVMSVPRDLAVRFPGSGTDKINSAFTRGGSSATARAVKAVLSRPGEAFEINHVVQVSFGDFRRAVDALGCTWIDVDRRYFNDRGGPGGYATIDIEPGYQRLCGRDSLDYVRYRHTDNDLVRGARQQDYLRQLLRQPGVTSRLRWDQRESLAELAGTYSRADARLRTRAGLFELAKLGLAVRDRPVVQVPFAGGRLRDDGAYLTAPRDAVADSVRRLLRSGAAVRAPAGRRPAPRSREPRRRASDWTDTAGMIDVARAGEDQAIAQAGVLGFRFAYPRLIPAGAAYAAGPLRRYSIRAGGEVHRAYRTVLDAGGGAGLGRYLGVQGTTWQDPPALAGPHEAVTVGGRRLEVFSDSGRVRLVAWRTADAVYWVSDTLTRDEPRARMIATARSLARVGD